MVKKTPVSVYRLLSCPSNKNFKNAILSERPCIHDDSEICKYESKCARNLCMYKHNFDQAECDINVTFQNPYLSEKFKCDSCGFVTTDKKEFELHFDEVKNKCSVCKELLKNGWTPNQGHDENRQPCLSGIPCYGIFVIYVMI